ncbi:hypothetical protein DGG96_08950 [Legionella qingyii]|uniref:Zinc chelation protein SecC n=1 Tax=Legionella qingyii TaxID=2184757 RepID=A0A317U207_9GAMM|nr:hypothetical protein DGG96_08950 [Legionella qingyii]RUR22085.1 hypothetical protein ELY20_10870 [Legionella qingyii]RUR25665.1 hypothetical protein ELY16_09680 [Legionella qingyii]
MEKYRHKANKSIGLGILCNNSDHLINTASYIEFPWEYDRNIEGLIDSETKPTPTKKKKTGRNSLCPCGSGKKYKKCCLNS